jgi:hypothetical protein
VGRIVDLADALAYGNLNETKLDGQMFEGLLEAAEDFVEVYCGRRFSPDPPLASDGSDTLTPVAKTFNMSPSQAVVRVPDLRVPVSVTLNGSTVMALTPSSASGGGYWLDSYDTPATRLYVSWPTWLTQLPYGQLIVTGRWGFLDAPAPVKQAVSALTMRMYRERDAAWADSVATPDGSVLSYFRQLPASIAGSLDLYKSGPKLAIV